jgi:hypothetical protein
MNKQLLIRKSHRYLGLFIGIQFIAWTVSGLYFSWNKIDNVHGDHLRKKISYLAADLTVVSPSIVIDKLKAKRKIDSIHSIHLIRILDKPAYQIAYFSGHSGEGMHLHTYYALADALTGELRKPLGKEEATQIANEQLVNGAQFLKAEYLQQTNGHHEYREKPLPVWAVTYTNPECTVYISAELGTFQSIRHNQWRAFDFLWMLHTMDYKERDNLNNVLLKTFSIFGLITVLSGFLLYFISSRTLKKITS